MWSVNCLSTGLLTKGSDMGMQLVGSNETAACSGNPMFGREPDERVRSGKP